MKTFENSYSLEKIYNSLNTIYPHFRINKSNSAIDFLLSFINIIDEEIKLKSEEDINIEPSTNNELASFFQHLNKNQENTPIYKMFSWINKKQEKCWNEENTNIIYQKYFTYDLDIENGINKAIIKKKKEVTTLDFIKYSCEEKNIYNIFCHSCYTKTNVEKKNSIFYAHKYLIFVLSGIENKKEVIEEINENKLKIKINRDLDLSKIIENKNSYKKFKLTGVIFYNTENKSHFAYCISPIDKNWYKYFGKEIKPAKIEDFIELESLTTFPIILVYTHHTLIDNN
jgi:hypothetical protein